jgi:mitochondrial fission protein ELM1
MAKAKVLLSELGPRYQEQVAKLLEEQKRIEYTARIPLLKKVIRHTIKAEFDEEIRKLKEQYPKIIIYTFETEV